MAGLHIYRNLLEHGEENEVIWFKYRDDAWSALQDMINLHIEFEHSTPEELDDVVVFRYASGHTVSVRLDPDYDKRG